MRMKSSFPQLLCIAAIVTPPAAIAEDEVFAVQEIPYSERVVTASFADFNGDGAEDLMLVTLDGIPPAESRTIHVHYQSEDGVFPEEPSRSVAVPRRTAVYDIADVLIAPGEELILLRPDAVSVISVATDQLEHWPVPPPTTVGPADDERGFERYRMAFDEFGDATWILVPQIGALTALASGGELLETLDVGRRANYYIDSGGGLLSIESDMQLYFDSPKISVGDIDGDGLADILAATRHELRVFLRDTDGGIPAEPSYSLALGLINDTDHTRGTGSVVTSARDIDADGRLDLMISHIEGTMVDTVTKTRIFMNREGRWNLDKPDDEFISEGSVTSDVLMDIDRDDALELIRIQFKFSVLEMVELLLTREIDAVISIHQLQDDGRFGEEPWSRKKIGTKISFETFRPRGFMPTAGLDLNADGLMDFIASANGKGIEVYLGGDEGPFSRRVAIQKMPTVGIIQLGDFNNDALADFVLFDPQTPDPTIRVGRNLGQLPGVPGASGAAVGD
jgi:hypothetical protein